MIGSIKRHYFSGQIETLFPEVTEQQAQIWIAAHGRHGQTFDAFHPERRSYGNESTDPLPRTPPTAESAARAWLIDLVYGA